MNIKVNPIFKDAIPPLSDDEYKGLEESIIKHGCRDPLVLWGDTIVDGHNRYEICTKHGIKFNTVQMDFEDENHATYWIIKNQLSRRNIGAGTRIILAKKLEPMLREMARERQRDAGGDKRSVEAKNAFVNVDKSDVEEVATAIDVRKEIASAAKVSTGTLAKFDKVQKVRPDLIEKVVSNEMSINKAYTTAKEEIAPAVEEKTDKESDDSKVRESLVMDIWKLLDAIDRFSSKHDPKEFACLVNTPEVERSMITGKIQTGKKILSSVANGFSAIGV